MRTEGLTARLKAVEAERAKAETAAKVAIEVTVVYLGVMVHVPFLPLIFLIGCLFYCFALAVMLVSLL